MPHISVTTNQHLTPEKELSLKASLGKAIALIPGKSESWLMVSIRPDTFMSFKGNADAPLAFVEVSIFGSASDSAYDALTAEITDILSSALGIAPSGIYVKYEEVSHWGWNGNNF